MPRRIAVSTLNASTIDILNVIRQNANYEYQSLVPEVESEHDIPKVGDILYGYPTLANTFVNALVNRIALVKVKSAIFNNAYAELKKGYLEYGETVEEVFVGITKARIFSPEKAEARELKRTLPDVRSAFHAINWRVQYPVTIQNDELRQAFTSMQGVQDLIARIVDAVYTAAEYDEYLLFKYLLIKAISKGKLAPVSFDSANMNNAATAFRGVSNKMTFMRTDYNSAGVTTATPKDDQYIFMDADFNARFDVEVLARAFNMDNAKFMGKLHLIDDWTTFDNERFAAIREESDMIEEVTEDELALLADVKAVILDKEWFQVYDNLTQFTEKYVSSGLYWNYFLTIWKTISSSPFSNAVVLVDGADNVPVLASLTAEVVSKDVSDTGTVLTFDVSPNPDGATLASTAYNFVQTQEAVEKGIAVHKYGAIIFPADQTTLTSGNAQIKIGDTVYNSAVNIATTFDVGDTVAFNKA